MGGLLIKTLRGLADINGTAPELNTYVVGIALLGAIAIAALFALLVVVRLVKWVWTHA